jgi:hypothetical protein
MRRKDDDGCLIITIAYNAAIFAHRKRLLFVQVIVDSPTSVYDLHLRQQLPIT